MEKQQQDQVDRNIKEAHEKLEMELMLMRQDLMRRQEELRRMEELHNQEVQKRKQLELRQEEERRHCEEERQRQQEEMRQRWQEGFKETCPDAREQEIKMGQLAMRLLWASTREAPCPLLQCQLVPHLLQDLSA